MRSTRDTGLGKTVGGVRGQSWSKTVRSDLEEELKISTQSIFLAGVAWGLVKSTFWSFGVGIK